ncbi:hypothetical protein [Micrococcus terreus]|uniref:hypothetical protein n=1 Tax=Micrococcus terreus TaxID=574650 RepID=UPI00301A18D8
MSSSTSGPNRGPSDRPASRPAGARDRRELPEVKNGFLASIKGPLVFSLVLGLVGGVVAMMTASGGTDNPIRVDIGLIAFGVFFMTSLVVVAMLQLASKENPEHLSQGSGIHRSSEQLHRQMVAQRKQELAEEKRRQAQAERDSRG